MTLADMCKYVRDKMHITQKALARIIGTNQTEVSFIERGFIPNDSGKISAIYILYFKAIGKDIQTETV